MKLKKITWVLVAVALALGVSVAGFEWRKSRSSETSSEIAAASKFWELQLDKIQQIAIQTPNQTLILTQTDNPSSPWQITEPVTSPANPAIVSYLTDLLVKAESTRSFTIARTESSDFGLDKPTATIAIQSKGRPTQTLALGQPDFQDRAIYATVDNLQSDNPLTVNLVSKDFQFAIGRDIAEWKAPPDAAGKPK